MRARWRVVAAAFAGAAACGGNVAVDGIGGQTGSGNQTGSQGSSGGMPSVSCDINSSGLHVCIELDNPTPTAIANLNGMCVGVGATLGTTCSSANRLGTCTMTAGAFPGQESFYNSGGITAGQAQMACVQSGGTWTAG